MNAMDGILLFLIHDLGVRSELGTLNNFVRGQPTEDMAPIQTLDPNDFLCYFHTISISPVAQSICDSQL